MRTEAWCRSERGCAQEGRGSDVGEVEQRCGGACRVPSSLSPSLSFASSLPRRKREQGGKVGAEEGGG
eukprot:2407355-Rhodomonas_salina.1